mgnify:CR=1 FL=1
MLTTKSRGIVDTERDQYIDKTDKNVHEPNKFKVEITSNPRLVQPAHTQPCGSLSFHVAIPHTSNTSRIHSKQEQNHQPTFIDFLGVGL